MAASHTNSLDGFRTSVKATTPNFYIIRRRIAETADTFTFELEPGDNGDHLTFSPGQFNMVSLPGLGEVPISISGDPAKPEILVHTIRSVGNVTGAFSRLKRGDRLGIRGPFGNCWPVKGLNNQDIILITGGIGLAPLRPVIYHLLANRDQYEYVTVLYGARTPEDMLYRKELEKLRARFDIDILVTVDRASADWKGNVGVVTSLIGRARFDPGRCTAMVCGPEIMMRFTIMELFKRNMDERNIFVSMERNMKCGIGLCGHCQIGPTFVCKDGPVYRLDKIKRWFGKREI